MKRLPISIAAFALCALCVLSFSAFAAAPNIGPEKCEWIGLFLADPVEGASGHTIFAEGTFSSLSDCEDWRDEQLANLPSDYAVSRATCVNTCGAID